MDLLTGWDFELEHHRKAAEEYIDRVQPKLVLGSPMCTMFSSLQNMNPNKDTAEWKLKYEQAAEHIKFMARIYRKQHEAGRWFLHEHPQNASSWKLEEMKTLAKENGVELTVIDQCAYGLKTWGTTGGKLKKDKFAKKPIKFMTNSGEIAQELSKRCNQRHTHQTLTGERARVAAEYPSGLCNAICRGLMNEIKMMAMQIRPLMILKHTDHVGKIDGGGNNLVDDRHEEAFGEAYDDISGAELNVKDVRKARLKELGYVDEKNVWTKMSRNEAIQKGIRVVDVRWIDINKGDSEKPDIRCRLVAKDFNTGREEGIFAATPPLEALKFLISEAATIEHGGKMEKVLMINDVARAFFEVPAHREVCVELPTECRTRKMTTTIMLPYWRRAFTGREVRHITPDTTSTS
jgi:hypothetical protein